MTIDDRLEDSKELSPMLVTVVEIHTTDIVLSSKNETAILISHHGKIPSLTFISVVSHGSPISK